MALTQTRPKDLVEYEQLDVGEEDYVDPEELSFVVDHSTFDKPMRFTRASSVSASVHTEKGTLTLTGASSKSISVTFSSEFSSIPDWQNIKVYKRVEVAPSKYRNQDVLWYDDEVTTSGFTLTIDASVNTDGVVIKYLFI